MLREGLELAACTAAIYLCFLGYGYLHEIMSQQQPTLHRIPACTTACAQPLTNCYHGRCMRVVWLLLQL